MSWERDFEGIPLEGKHTIYSFLFRANEVNHTYDTMCDKELTAKRRYIRYLKKFGDYKLVELISFWRYVWEDGKLNDEKTNLIYHIRGLHEE
jgi:hypothetical protein|tara:strand:+ start:1700 stop:1975 length:276 start_codon:yes stop_codon:yes gene_type:complete